MENIEQRVKDVFAKSLSIKREILNSDSFDTLGADSLDSVGVVMALEEEFSIGITDEAVESIHTVGDAISYLEKNTA